MQKRTVRACGLVGATLLLLALAREARFYVPRRIRPPKGVAPMVVDMKTTSYCHCRKCCSYRRFLFVPYQRVGKFGVRIKRVGITASGARTRPGTIAADTSIYPFGTIMKIPGYGYGVVQDTGGAVKGNHIDLYRPNHNAALAWGARPKRVEVWLPEGGPPAGQTN